MSTKLGAHLSIAGGYTIALSRIVERGGTCLQIFSSSPRGWSFAKTDPDTITAFRKEKEKKGIDPIYFHASYLVNTADQGRIGQLSCNSLIHELQLASQLHVKGSIVHLGSFKDQNVAPSPAARDKYTNVVVCIKKILEKTPQDTLFIIENAGNRKIGKDLTEIATIINEVHDPRVRVCLDTCHLYSAGYDLSSQKKLDDFLTAFDSLIGIEKLELFHLNDSRDPFNSGRDRHENIGQGTVGLETFRLLLNHPKTKHLPFIIEVPGFDAAGPDKKNIDILKSLIQP